MKPYPPIIGLAGKAGAGKSTTAAAMLEALGRPYCIQSFASPVREIALAMGWDGVKDEKGRKLLVAVGMAGRAYGADTWIKQLDFTKRCVIDDVRFPNEVEAIRKAGGVVIYIRHHGHKIDNEAERLRPEECDGEVLRRSAMPETVAKRVLLEAMRLNADRRAKK